MVDTTDSNSVAARREGSTPSPRTDEKCTCGLYDADPLHYGWHKIVEHNDLVFSEHRRKKEKQFDASLREREKLQAKVEARRMRMVRFNEGGNP